MNVSVFEILMLLCFACSWPFSIVRALRTKVVIGKSPVFMSIIILGYVFGILHKVFYNYDWVVYLYLFNLLIVSFDLFLYFKYIGQNRRDLMSEKTADSPSTFGDVFVHGGNACVSGLLWSSPR